MAEDKRVPLTEIQNSTEKYGHTFNGKSREKELLVTP